MNQKYVLFACIYIWTASIAGGAEFREIASYFPRGASVQPVAISDDGQRVLLNVQTSNPLVKNSFIYDASSGQYLQIARVQCPSSDNHVVSSAMSRNGRSVIAGQCKVGTEWSAYVTVWTDGVGTKLLIKPKPGEVVGGIWVADDGASAVLTSYKDPVYEATVWKAPSQLMKLGLFDATINKNAPLKADDLGNVIGLAGVPFERRPYYVQALAKWPSDYKSPQLLYQGPGMMALTAASNDGRWVAGFYEIALGSGVIRGFRYSEGIGPSPIRNTLGAKQVTLKGISNDGETIVGDLIQLPVTNRSEPAVWERSGGWKLLRNRFADAGLGAAIKDYFLSSASLISGDGKTIVGIVNWGVPGAVFAGVYWAHLD